MAVSPTTSPLSGLPRRLVQDGIAAEDTVLSAIQGSKADPGGLVAYLVSRNLADPRQIAIAAASEFGVPLLDLDALETDLEAVKSVDRQLLSTASCPCSCGASGCSSAWPTRPTCRP